MRGLSDLDTDKIAYQIMEQHCKAIATEATGIGLIITDTERFVMQDDKIVSRTDLLKALKLPPTPTLVHNEEWDLFFAPHPDPPTTIPTPCRARSISAISLKRKPSPKTALRSRSRRAADPR